MIPMMTSVYWNKASHMSGKKSADFLPFGVGTAMRRVLMCFFPAYVREKTNDKTTKFNKLNLLTNADAHMRVCFILCTVTIYCAIFPLFQSAEPDALV